MPDGLRHAAQSLAESGCYFKETVYIRKQDNVNSIKLRSNMRNLKNHIQIDNKSYDELTMAQQIKFDSMCRKLEGIENLIGDNDIISLSTRDGVLNTKSPNFPNEVSERIIEAFIQLEF